MGDDIVGLKNMLLTTDTGIRGESTSSERGEVTYAIHKAL